MTRPGTLTLHRRALDVDEAIEELERVIELLRTIRRLGLVIEIRGALDVIATPAPVDASDAATDAALRTFGHLPPEPAP